MIYEEFCLLGRKLAFALQGCTPLDPLLVVALERLFAKHACRVKTEVLGLRASTVRKFQTYSGWISDKVKSPTAFCSPTILEKISLFPFPVVRCHLWACHDMSVSIRPDKRPVRPRHYNAIMALTRRRLYVCTFSYFVRCRTGSCDFWPDDELHPAAFCMRFYALLNPSFPRFTSLARSHIKALPPCLATKKNGKPSTHKHHPPRHSPSAEPRDGLHSLKWCHSMLLYPTFERVI